MGRFSIDREYGEQVERVVMVGQKKWLERISKLRALFANTKVRKFALADVDQPERWLRRDWISRCAFNFELSS